ncbi:MAG: L,D-transpeptidase family protein [Rhizobiales bacterium]|nr:L,D-transpeptidase family protein [Hyphomicrobiales bacterium]
MQRKVLIALTLGATVISAQAEPLSLASALHPPSDSRASLASSHLPLVARPEPQAVQRAPATAPHTAPVRPVQHAQVRQRHYAAPRDSNLGGGFIEFLFNRPEPRRQQTVAVPPPEVEPTPAPMERIYAPLRHASAPPVRAIRPAMDPKFLPTIVDYHGSEKPGTIIINTPERLLYLVLEDGTAKRYGIGVGRPGFTWAGNHSVTAKKEWPDWRPPDEMLKRQPHLPHFMAGGPNNPLGARALYLGSTLYRVHGSNEPWTIGHAVSSGCIRMRNQDVMDLYDRVGVGTKVVVI